MSFAGIARTDVAVGTVSDASMLWTTRADTPRIGSSVEALGVTKVGIGLAIGSAGVAGVVERERTIGCVTGAEATGVGCATTGAATGATGAAGVGCAEP